MTAAHRYLCLDADRLLFALEAHKDGWPVQARFRLEWGSSTTRHIALRFAKQQVDMLRHDDVTINPKPETVLHPLQR